MLPSCFLPWHHLTVSCLLEVTRFADRCCPPVCMCLHSCTSPYIPPSWSLLSPPHSFSLTAPNHAFPHSLPLSLATRDTVSTGPLLANSTGRIRCYPMPQAIQYRHLRVWDGKDCCQSPLLTQPSPFIQDWDGLEARWLVLQCKGLCKGLEVISYIILLLFLVYTQNILIAVYVISCLLLYFCFCVFYALWCICLPHPF